MPRVYVEDYRCQVNKKGHSPCGDVIRVLRRPEATTAILADGMGSGLPANLSALLTVDYLLGLIGGGVRHQKAVSAAVRMLHSGRMRTGPWAAFTMAHMESDGRVTFYSYEAPAPLVLTASGVEEPVLCPELVEGEILHTATTYLRTTEAVLLISDGVAQAGIGKGLPRGWGLQGVRRYLALDRPWKSMPMSEVTEAVVRQAITLSQGSPDDDISAVGLSMRQPVVLCILTGPPANRADTESVLSAFMAEPGRKAVCGGTTANLLSKHLGVPLKVYPGERGAPAHFDLEGVDLACEGTITLNRVNNVFFDPDLADEAGYGPSELLRLMNAADEIHFWVGRAVNLAHASTLKPAGLLPRQAVVDSLACKLQHAGKLVHIKRL